MSILNRLPVILIALVLFFCSARPGVAADYSREAVRKVLSNYPASPQFAQGSRSVFYIVRMEERSLWSNVQDAHMILLTESGFSDYIEIIYWPLVAESTGWLQKEEDYLKKFIRSDFSGEHFRITVPRGDIYGNRPNQCMGLNLDIELNRGVRRESVYPLGWQAAISRGNQYFFIKDSTQKTSNSPKNRYNIEDTGLNKIATNIINALSASAVNREIVKNVGIATKPQRPNFNFKAGEVVGQMLEYPWFKGWVGDCRASTALLNVNNFAPSVLLLVGEPDYGDNIYVRYWILPRKDSPEALFQSLDGGLENHFANCPTGIFKLSRSKLPILCRGLGQDFEVSISPFLESNENPAIWLAFGGKALTMTINPEQPNLDIAKMATMLVDAARKHHDKQQNWYLKIPSSVWSLTIALIGCAGVVGILVRKRRMARSV